MSQMATAARGLFALLARLMIAAIFLFTTLGDKIPRFTVVAQTMAQEGVPNPRLLLFGAIGLVLIGGISLLAGAWTRMGAAFLFVFLAAATFYFHDFWVFGDPTMRRYHVEQFLKNMAIGGGLLALVAFGGGPWSVDGWIEARREEAEAGGGAAAGAKPRVTLKS